MRSRANEGIDTSGQLGLAKPYYEKVIAIADTSADKDKVKVNEITAYRYMVAYYYNIKKDLSTASEFNGKILVLDPADALALKNKEVFAKLKAAHNK
jgi:hypothetical protein